MLQPLSFGDTEIALDQNKMNFINYNNLKETFDETEKE